MPEIIFEFSNHISLKNFTYWVDFIARTSHDPVASSI
ncbi:hypothetical protein SAMN05216297_12045 [Flavobacterium phragmitis]|uniref:Uncharacterized protein n=1 Tax=Flavobacterium phragmitis TaxID=739143 RepID=A0A1I1XNW8_9FLAO|nr:hypothetical protein SAMN05216297_12045 [Flavobacterium phragmitis]